MAKELNETFPGIEAVNDFYTPYYMKEYCTVYCSSCSSKRSRRSAMRR